MKTMPISITFSDEASAVLNALVERMGAAAGRRAALAPETIEIFGSSPDEATSAAFLAAIQRAADRGSDRD